MRRSRAGINRSSAGHFRQNVAHGPEELLAVVDFMRATEVCVVERACLEYLEYAVPEVFTQKAEATPYFVGTATPRLVSAVPPRYREARCALREHLDAWSPFGFIAGPIAESPGVRGMLLPKPSRPLR